MTSKEKLIGPFTQILPLRNLPLRGALHDEQLEIISDGGIVVKDGHIVAIGKYEELRAKMSPEAEYCHLKQNYVALPGFVDAHTHLCFGGNRANDFALRNSGKTYLEIAKEGGGIWKSVTDTRDCDQYELEQAMLIRMNHLIAEGVTTVEIKSGYGLSVEEELKQLRAIKAIADIREMDIVTTCLAAHVKPKDYEGSHRAYLDHLLDSLIPVIEQEKLCKRIDIFIDEGAFTPEDARYYLTEVKKRGFEVVVHGDQFSVGGSQIAIEVGAKSVEHLEASGPTEIAALGASDVVPVVLPGASIGLGMPFGPARKLLDAGCSVVIASDLNPGSAPHGHLLTLGSILATYEKLSTAEVFAGMTVRPAHLLGYDDRGELDIGKKADIIGFNAKDYRHILYRQGQLKVSQVWKNGEAII